jgi:O-methyltransferase involved in polyketide biosynthesis
MNAGPRVELTAVPETLLWNLYHRAIEARRPDRVLTDPRAVELVDSLDFPFERRFGAVDAGRRLAAHGQALRARCFDDQVRAFLLEYPEGTVVALGEGLETQFWRVDNGRVRWLSVDLPEVVALRRRLLAAGPSQRLVACSVLDERWMAAVGDEPEVLITAQGLLMYLQPAQVYRLIAGCARRFPGGWMCLDAVPRSFSARTLRGAMATREGYRPPPMPWGMDPGEVRRLPATVAGVAEAREVPLPRGRGLVFGYLAPLPGRLPGLRGRRLNPFAPWSIVVARFDRAPGQT